MNPHQAELDKLKFFAKPKLALDAVGGLSSTRLSDMLAEGGQLVVYGCMSGKSPTWTWHSWVFQGIQVTGKGWVQYLERATGCCTAIARGLSEAEDVVRGSAHSSS